MNSTYFGLLAEFGEANIPLARVPPKYFGLSFEEARRRAPTQLLPCRVFRLGGQKSPWLVSAPDLAELIDRRRRQLRSQRNRRARMARSVLRCRRHELAEILGLEIRVTLELVPRVVERELRHLVDLVAALEQAAGGLVTQVVKTQVLDPQDVARAGEGRPDASRLVGEDVCTASGLSLHDRPGLWRVLESSMIAFLCGRVFGVPYDAGPGSLVVVPPFQPADLRLAPGGGEGKLQDASIGICERLSRCTK